jgi:hypothetical protein
MSYALDNRFIYLRRRVLALLVVAVVLVAAALLATSSLAAPGTVHAHVTRDGSTIVSGFDGGAPLAPRQ